LPSSALAQFSSPFHALFSSIPDYKALKVFASFCFPLLRPYNQHKLQFRSSECVFLGVSPQHKGFKCLSSEGRIFISKDVKFNENRFPYTSLFGVTTVSSDTDLSQSLPLSPVTTSTNSHSLSAPNISPLTAATDDMSSTPRCSSSFDSPTVSTSDHQPSSSATISPSLDTTLPNHNPPSSSLPLNTHPMLTRSKTGHSKPKAFIAHLEPSSVKPTTIRIILTLAFDSQMGNSTN